VTINNSEYAFQIEVLVATCLSSILTKPDAFLLPDLDDICLSTEVLVFPDELLQITMIILARFDSSFLDLFISIYVIILRLFYLVRFKNALL
jgi:hypothetical protein